MDDMGDRILTPTEAAARRGCSVDTLRRDVRSGRLAYVRVSNRRWGVRLRDLLASQTPQDAEAVTPPEAA